METNTTVNMIKKSKWRFIWIVPIALLIITAVPKLIQMEFMVENMTNAGMGHMILGVGIIEIICVIAFLIPKTRNIGFLLAVAYTGGIIAAEWAAKEPVIPGLVIMILLWIGWYFENPEWFQLKKSSIESKS
ncbi:MAG: DoxX family protein [Bacteroidota bacterium]